MAEINTDLKFKTIGIVLYTVIKEWKNHDTWLYKYNFLFFLSQSFCGVRVRWQETKTDCYIDS